MQSLLEMVAYVYSARTLATGKLWGAAYSNNFVPSYILVKKVGKGSIADFVTELRDKNNFKMVKRKKKGDGFVAIKEAISKGRL